MQNHAPSENDNVWLGVIGRALAFLCLKESELRNENIATQARFLESLGLPRKDAALLLRTSEASLRELLRLESLEKKKMAPRKKEQSSNSEQELTGDPSLKRLTDLAALLLIKGESQNEKLRILAAAGYSAPEIARFVGSSANAVNVALHRLRKKK
jgi:hypothetical protein